MNQFWRQGSYLVAALLATSCTEKPTPAEAQTEAGAEAQTEAGAEAQTEAGAGAGADAGADADAGAGAEAGADAGAAAVSGPCPAGMAFLPAGTFRLGENGRHASVSAFCIDTLEVTVAKYTACVRAGQCSPRCIEEKRCSAVPVDTEWGNPAEDIRASGLCNGGIPGREEHPVNCVSFEESAAYCKAQNKRLPREEEWEWAARSGKKARRYPWGQLDAKADELCWSRLHKGRPFKRGSTCKVASFPMDKTEEGVFDLAGNISEWVIAKPHNKEYPALRGASFWAVDDGYIKAALWGFDSTAPRSEVFGFRCVVEKKE